MDEEHYECRLLRHAWKFYTPEDGKRTTGVWRTALHLRCLRCGMSRHDAFDRDGGVVTRRYDPPKGYYLSKGEERPEVEQLRLWAVKRQRRIAGQRRQESAARSATMSVSSSAKAPALAGR